MSAPELTAGTYPNAYMRFDDGLVLSVCRRGDAVLAGCISENHPTTLTEFTLDQLSELIEALRALQEPELDDAIFYEIRTLVRVTGVDGTSADRFDAGDLIRRSLTDAGFVAATVDRGRYRRLLPPST